MAEVTIRAADGGSFQAYLATPKSGKGPGVLVIQEIFGINAWIRSVAEGLAGQGFTALAPDLFWRQQPGIQLTDKTKAEWDKAFALMRGFDTDKGVDDLKAALAVLRKHPACTGKAGSVGFCLGGKLAYLMATRSDADCNVGYYGVGLQDLLGEAKNMRKPLLLHIAEKDQFTPPPAQEKIKAALKDNALVTLYAYPDQDHAFARDGGEHHDRAAAELAGRRSLDFFRRHLGAS